MARNPTRRFRRSTARVTHRGALVATVLASGLFCASSAHAQSSPTVAAVLRYERDVAAARCPDESALRDAVAGRLGYDPFRPDAPLTITVSITRAPRGLRAQVWREGAGSPRSAPRTLTSPRLDCVELGGAVALTVAIAVDPLTASGAAPVASPPPAPSPPAPSPPPGSSPAPAPPTPASPPSPDVPAASAAPPPATIPAPLPSRDTLHVTLRVGIVGALGFQPALTVGFLGAFGLRWRALSLELEAAGYLASVVTAANGVRARAGLVTGALVPCAHVGWFAACGLIAIGGMRGDIEGANPVSQVTPFAALGARAALDLQVAGPFRVYAHADVLGALTPTELRLDGAVVWSSFPVSGTLGAGVAVRFR